jgi:hypothetical protein
MNKGKPIGLIAMCIVIALVVCGYLFGPVNTHSSSSSSEGNSPAIQAQYKKANSRELNKERMTSLFAAVGIAFDETSILPSQVDSARKITVRWKATDAELKGGNLTFLTTIESREGLRRQRSFELSPTLILVAAINEKKQLLWWSLQPDPRILRAENADSEGNLSGKTLYHEDADFIVTVPSDSNIKYLRFYQPLWDGSAFSLKSIGDLDLSVTHQ